MLLKVVALLLVANVFVVFNCNATSENDAKPIEVTLFYEALCPYCSRFITGQLVPAWKRLGKTGILKVNLHAYGNCKARQSGDRWVFHCQHGQRECDLNQYTTCAFKDLNDDQKIGFVNCIERYPYTTYVSYCLKTIHVDPTSTLECFTSLEGNQMQKAVGDIQAKLDPRLRYVPWIVVDGVHSQSIQSSVQRDTVRYVCNAYQGPKPAECNGYLDDE